MTVASRGKKIRKRLEYLNSKLMEQGLTPQSTLTRAEKAYKSLRKVANEPDKVPPTEEEILLSKQIKKEKKTEIKRIKKEKRKKQSKIHKLEKSKREEKNKEVRINKIYRKNQ